MKSLLLSLLLCPIAALAVPITVRVTDEAGAPVEGATVQVQRYGEGAPTFVVETTDAQGAARYELDATQSNADFYGRALAWKAGFAVSGGVLAKLKDGEATLIVRPVAAVGGVITDADGPIEGALVQLQSAVVGTQSFYINSGSPLARQLSVRSDAQGRFVVPGAPAATGLSLRVGGEKYASQTVQAQSGDADLKVRVQPGATLRGRVLDADGAPLRDLFVLAETGRTGGDLDEAIARTDENGDYVLSGLRGGVYRVVFVPATDANYVVAALQKAPAAAGAERELETARAIAGVVVRGRVVSADAREGIAGVTVGVTSAARPDRAGVYTDKDGNFSTRVAPGAVSVSIANAPQKWENLARPLAFDVGADSEPKPLTFELTPAIALRGRFVDEQGQGVQTDLVVRQEFQELLLQPDENGDFEIYPTLKGEAKIGRSMFARNDDDAAPSWEVVRGGTFSLPATEPIQIVVRRALVGALSGKIEDETGAPISGVELKVSIANGEGVGSTSRWKTVVSDVGGRFLLPNIRSDEIVKLRGLEKTGYDLQSDAGIVRDGASWKLQTVKMQTRRSQLAGRVTLSDGAPAAGARVFAAGSETRADETGAYVLPVLPAGNADVFVYASGQFGFVSAQTALPNDAATASDIKLAPQPLQPTDRELAGEMIARARVLAAQTKPDEIGRLKLGDADARATLEALIANPPARAEELVKSLYFNAGNPDVSTDLLLRALRTTNDPSWRLYAATALFAKRPDWPDDEATRELAATLARDAETIAAAAEAPNKWLNAVSLVGIAPLIEKFQGSAAGAAALARGIEWTKTQFPQPGNGNIGGYLSMFAAGAESIAANSPALFSQLLQAIDDPTSPAYTRALRQGIAEIAKNRGLEAAEPFLRQLSAAPNPNDDGGPGPVTNSAARAATREAIEVGGAKSPALALQLARGLGADNNDIEDEGARALAEAAFFQSPAVAADLWRESLPQLQADRAAQIAVRVAKSRPELGAQLLELARQKLDASEKMNSWGGSVVAAFAFYEAQTDAAAARYRLEKAWWKERGQTDDFRIKPDLVRAMATIDGERAFEWASLLPTDGLNGDTRVDALSQAARYIEADARSRARVDFERWRYDSTVFIG